ncbi:hypothetical protein BUALT_Bualt09G0130000 [Buddleja alternifolia]|uniref:Trichome birefringence-like N-terminal domain-containing protein n=1 Tax=Buddleja alternifolia TaxID=168488 RepID=A0AAV6XD29_9LAMI|nr:hypothetical protein BUALT_Bualt09G0130000 [Buddleja alternifolia]
MVHKTLENVFNFHNFAGLLLLTLVAAAIYVRRDINWNIVKEQFSLRKEQSTTNCDYFSGRWVYDNVSLPLYKEQECTFMEDTLACETYGRKDLKYRHWRWQPNHCDIPRFNGSALLEKLRGKKLIFVGDSLNRNQWRSMLCLLEPSLPPLLPKKLTYTGNFDLFQNNEYNTTVGFYWSPYLVESNCDSANHFQLGDHVVKIKSIEKHARHWNDADILIFDTYAWWLTISKASLGSSNATDVPTEEMKQRCYEMALSIWSDWLEINVNRSKTKLFFMGASPFPQRGDDLSQCHKETEPFPKEGFSTASNQNMTGVAKSAIQKLEKRGLKVKYLPITEMSELRRDAHPSIYRRFYTPVTEENRKDPATYADCKNAEQRLLTEENSKKMNLGTWKIRFKSHYLAVFVIVSLISAAIYLSAENEPTLEEKASRQEQQIARDEERKTGKEEEKILNKEGNITCKNDEKIARNESASGCNLFSGKWIFDNVSNPLYKEGECSFMLKDYSCEKNGRKDLKYQSWRWQPHDCDLPRFNGKALLEKIRGKRLVFVGDSLNKNQWTSMLCLIESSLHPSSSKLVTLKGNSFIFQATEYNATIEFYWSPLLVESNCDDPAIHRSRDRIMRIKSIEKHARHWTDADILIFDSFMWWLEPTMTILWGSFESSDAIYKRVEMKLRRYEIALSTWSDCGETMGVETYCHNETEPILKEDYWGITTDREMMGIAESTIEKLESRGLKLEYLNITHLSDYRKDAHPAIHRHFYEPLTQEQLANPKSHLDCVHWCLPGVPDKMGKNTLKSPHFIIVALLTLLVIVIRLTRKNANVVHLEDQVLLKQEVQTAPDQNDTIPGCNLFSGRWVYDNVSYPLYKEHECSFMERDFACELYGRKDLKYQNWRWQPHHCDIPRFNGTALLEKLRGKKLVYVGDSLNRNQWKSMLCLIDSYLPPSSTKQVNLTGNLYSFHSSEYNATIGFYWAPMLVESNCDDVNKHRVQPRIVRINSIKEHGKDWIDADILIFDSFAWWLSRTMTILWGSFGSSDAIYRTVEMKLRRYEIALTTWSDWLEMNINRKKTKLFFMSASPYRSGDTLWGTDPGCHWKTEPTFDESYWASSANRSMMSIAESTIKKLEKRGVKVEYLNITQLSGYREDAHPSTYRTFWKLRSREQFKDPNVYSDCLHWCLPGVPDVWNEILYAYIMKS